MDIAIFSALLGVLAVACAAPFATRAYSAISPRPRSVTKPKLSIVKPSGRYTVSTVRLQGYPGFARVTFLADGQSVVVYRRTPDTGELKVHYAFVFHDRGAGHETRVIRLVREFLALDLRLKRTNDESLKLLSDTLAR